MADKISAASDQHDAYRIALYYCYIPLHDIDAVVSFHTAFQANLGGRIRVASEGLNGVLSARHTDLIRYEEQLRRFLATLATPDSQSKSEKASSWELDVKYCKLRPDLTVQSQLFSELEVDKTSSVVGLVDMHGYRPYESNQENNSTKKGYSGNRRQRRKHAKKNDESTQQLHRAQEIFYKSLANETATNQTTAAPHLSPVEWNEKLQELADQPDAKVVLLDCRNSYESAVGYFQAPGSAVTLLTNTRKYSELPGVLMEQSDKSIMATASHIFMYCTGGVRCERASGFLQTLLAEKQKDETKDAALPQIYQLHGGIQRYLESSPDNGSLFYKGKNFVFDPRRTDPAVGQSAVVGQCLVCAQPHDDYDNGHAPAANMEARCYKCRILVLICNTCRSTVTCWGEISENVVGSCIGESSSSPPAKPKLFCGGLEPKDCLHMPPVREIRSYDE